jgi:hypothetical protein
VSADFEDWTRGITLVTGSGPVTDFPDWTTAVQTTGGGGAGYASLTGPGETTTPGDLTQLGGLRVTDTGSGGFEVFTDGPLQVTCNNGNPLLVENTGTGGVKVYANGAGPLTLLADTNASLIHVEANGGGGVNVVNVESVGSGGAVGIAGGANAGFLTPTANRVQIAGRNFLDLWYGANSGAAKGARGIHIQDVSAAPAGILLTVNAGNPNGVFSGTNNGDLCVDTSTPNLWQWHSGSTSWVAL